MSKSDRRQVTHGTARLPDEQRASSLRCGDCQALVEGTDRTPESSLAGDSELYCANCAAAAARTVVCRACGSTICVGCGTPVELADELGIG